MSIWAAIAGGLLKDVGNIVDEVITSKEERLTLKERLAKTIGNIQTTRHSTDMMSDSWLSKNIRPLVLVFLMLMMLVFAVTDGNVGGFTVQPTYIKLIEVWGGLAFSFYFGFRGLEKSVSIFAAGKQNRRDKRKQRKEARHES